MKKHDTTNEVRKAHGMMSLHEENNFYRKSAIKKLDECKRKEIEMQLVCIEQNNDKKLIVKRYKTINDGK